MTQLQVGDRTIELDEGGFMVSPEEWDEEIAVELSKMDCFGTMTDDHWRVLRCIRGHYEKYEAAPMMRLVTRRTNLTEADLERLFLSRCGDCMCRIAGLPKPTG